MSDDWIPPGFVHVIALMTGQHGVKNVRDDLYEGRRQAFKWDGSAGSLDEIEPRYWCSHDAERWLKEGWIPHRSDELPPCMIVVRVEDEPKPATDGVYLSPYMVLMQEAVRRFKISMEHYPTKEVLQDYFRAQTVDGKPVTPNLASQLATLCRPPHAMRGGNRKG